MRESERGLTANLSLSLSVCVSASKFIQLGEAGWGVGVGRGSLVGYEHVRGKRFVQRRVNE